MENNLMIFDNEEFGEVRTIKIDDIPYAVANDVLKALGYSEGSWRTTLSRKCKGVTKCNGLKVNGIEVNLIPEGDIYRLIIGSKLPSAEKFERWIFDDVIPSIRKHGAYIVDDVLDKMISTPEFGIKLLTELKLEKEKRLEAENKLVIQAPKVEKYDRFLKTNSTHTFTDTAKIISTWCEDDGINLKITVIKLTQLLREKGILSKNKSKDKYLNHPNKDYENYFQTTSVTINEGENNEFKRTSTRVKSNGVDMIYELVKEYVKSGEGLFNKAN